MSWQAYIDTSPSVRQQTRTRNNPAPEHTDEQSILTHKGNFSLVGTGHITKGAIISVAGDSTWATSTDLQVTPDEMKAISAIVSGDNAAKDRAFAEGLFVGGERYVMARAEDRSIYARQGRNGVAIAKTKQAIVIGQHGEAQVAGNASSTVEGLADYLIGQGY